MKNLKRLGVAFALTFVLGVAAFAGEMSTGPCAPPDPGEVNTPPCAAAPRDMGEPPAPSTAPGIAQTPGFAEIAASVLESLLPLF